MEGNILFGGIKELEALEQKLSDLTICRNQSESFEIEESRLEKIIKGKEKEIADEIAATLRQRKEEIEKTYNSQIDLTRQQIRKIKNKKLKSKTEKMSERIESETAGEREKYRQQNLEIKDLYKEDRIPRILHNRIFYSLFFPGRPIDLLIILLIVALLLLALPYVIYTQVLPNEKKIYLFLIYAIDILVFGGFYLLLENIIKNRHRNTFSRVLRIRKQMSDTHKKIKNIRKEILKDKDEMIFLLMGVDDEYNTGGVKRLKEKRKKSEDKYITTGYRSDTMILCKYNFKTGEISMLSIPRDTKTNIRGRKNQEKITHAHSYGGPYLAMDAVRDLLKIDLKYYATVDYLAVKEIVDFAEATGFEIMAIGKGKNNPIDYDATPESVKEQAIKSGLKPLRLASFIDGTNTMVEMAAMANATGFLPDVRGGHGPTTDAKNLPKVYSLKENGGILNKYKIVDYAHGVAPGVFVIVTTSLPQVHHEMRFLKMGDGPNYVLYRPFHLTSLETPISIARAALYNEPTIVPIYDKPVAEVITMAKMDLKKGQRLDGIGEYTVIGSIDTYEKAAKENLLPIGLVNENTIVKQDIKKGEAVTYDMVELDKTTMIYKLRQLQEAANI